jgi:23S rRNA (uracil1939-C5)-methyltransferase
MNKETAIIEKLVPGGQALATLADGKKAFIWGTMPGETVEFELTKNKKTYCEGVAIRIIANPSEHRVAPKDDCYLSTSPWQIMDFSYELQQKSELTRECFRQNHLNLVVLPTITDGKDYFYRNKMEYSLYWDHDTAKIHLAFHKRGSHGKQPITQSSIERPEIFARASQIVDQLNAKHAEARTYQSLLLRCNQQGKVSGDLFVNGQPHPIMANLSDELLGQNYTYSPNGFFQINLPVYELALQAIAKEIHTEKVLDLYAGVGSIGLSVARDKDLTLVEVNSAAYQEMQNNAQNLPNATCILDKSENVASYITPDCTVILDPPRAGCEASLIHAINEVQPEKLIYLSCNPVTQARDLAMLANTYQIAPLQPFNFFPHTPHIENLAILTRK